ncbi:MAG: thiolase family protein [Candidatus Brocadiia bacterium]
MADVAVKGFRDKTNGYGSTYQGVVIVGAARTPFGRFMGSLAGVSAIDLGVIASRAALEKANLKPELINSVIYANVAASAGDAFFAPRHVGLYTGAPIETPAYLVQRICSSSFEAIAQAAEHIALGKASLVLAGGTENLTQVPIASFGGRMGSPLGRPNFVDYLWEAFYDTACGCAMGQTAENLAKKYNITRKECDEFAVLSQSRAANAIKSGYFKDEIAPVLNGAILKAHNLKAHIAKLPRGMEVLDKDEHPRETNVEKLGKLDLVYNKETGVQTAGNSCGIVDGAASVLVTSEKDAKAMGVKPLGRVIASSASGVSPDIMGIGPVPSCRLAMEIAGLKLKDIDLIEINEAFAAQYIAVERELGLDRNKSNVDGGAIAYGHPYGATGARLVMTLLYKLRRLGKRYGMASACIGGGQGMAVIVEAF